MKRINITQAATRAGFAGAFALAAVTFASDSPQTARPAQLNVTDPASVPAFAHARAVNATPEQLAAIAAERSAASPAMSAYIDAASGRLRVITAEDLNANASPGPETSGVVEHLENGAVRMSLDDSHAAYSVARIEPNGELRQACLENQASAQDALVMMATAPEVDSHEK